MKPAIELAPLSYEDLLDCLAQGAVSGVCAVTPNARLAAALARDFDLQQAARGRTSWESADILPLAAFMERLYEDALYSDLAPRLPLLLTATQEQAIWEDAVSTSEAGEGLLSVPGAASLARSAWQLVHAWRLLPGMKHPANEDAKAFADWAWRYEGLTSRDAYIDRARLPDALSPLLASGALRQPRLLVTYGFDIVTAQQADFLAALEHSGVPVRASAPAPRGARACRVGFVSTQEEMRAAARWARQRLEAHSGAAPRIGIVVPDLRKARASLRRALLRVMQPAGTVLPFSADGAASGPQEAEGASAQAPPFNISLGEPLVSTPLAAAAFMALELAGTAGTGEAVPLAEVSRLLRSPFLAGAETEFSERALLDRELRKLAPPEISLEALTRLLARASPGGGGERGRRGCPVLIKTMRDFLAFAREHLAGAKRPGEWARVFAGALDVLGFPGERTLDSAEYQTLKKLHDVVADFAALDHVSGRQRFHAARTRLLRHAGETLFQAEAPDVPVQVLGVLESAGLEFDYLWVMGLTDEAWPIPPRPNPLVPLALQRAAGVPQSSSASALELDARLTRGWLESAPEVVFSHALVEDDRDLSPSPLILHVPEARPEELALPEYAELRAVLWRARDLERKQDGTAPPLRPTPTAGAGEIIVPGGTGLFRDQAACAFRAFAIHRLRAEALEAPGPGLDAGERGSLLHAMLAKLWADLESKERLDALSAVELDERLETASDHAITQFTKRRPEARKEPLLDLERRRLVKLGRDWLALEKQRAPFRVVAVEQKQTVSFGGLRVSARLDRMDAIPGGYAVLDYKTGPASVAAWLGARPDEPQLPLYALSGAAGEPVSALAFACLKTGAMGFKGLSRDVGQIPGVKPLEEQRAKEARQYPSWDALVGAWHEELHALGDAFAQGEAGVDPKHLDETCRYCELRPLCRIDERTPSLGDADDGPNGA